MSVLEHIVVAAAVICRDEAFLVTRRLRGTHLAGYWEFPGGKCNAGEPLDACLNREIAEELDAGVLVGPELHHVSHAYADRIVELHFFECELLGEPQPVLGQEMRWVQRHELGLLEFPAADADLVAMLVRGRGRSTDVTDKA